MSYLTISKIASNASMRNRIGGCCAEQNPDAPEHPLSQADRIMWQCCAEPGWSAAWESAEAAQAALPAEGRTDIGADSAVITDAMILSAVQKHLNTPDTPAQTPA